MEQRDFKMPQTGEAWRHYKNGLYTIIGMARDDKGDAYVVYTDYGWSLIQLPGLYTQPLARFIQDVENDKPRFRYERGPGGDQDCPFLHPTKSNGFRAVA